MKFAEYSEDPRVWADNHFGEATLSDVRRVDRVVTIAEAMAMKPGDSIPEMFASPYDVKATYNLFNHVEATPDQLQAGHRDLTIEALYQPGEYLLLGDDTSLEWNGKAPIPGLGPIGDGSPGLQGFNLHTVLAVRWADDVAAAADAQRPPIEVIGLPDQQYWVRPIPEQVAQSTKQQDQQGTQDQDSSPPKKSKSTLRKRQYADPDLALESKVWEQSLQHIGPAPEGVRWVSVGDRGSDIYEHLKCCQDLGYGFVLRAKQNRVVLDPETKANKGLLFDAMDAAPSLGSFTLELRTRPDTPGRLVSLNVSATPILLRAPQRPGYPAGQLPPLYCTAVRVWEEGATKDPLEWRLLCDGTITTFEQALKRVRQYSVRWLIEEFHKALKSGLGAERLQLESAHRLMAAIAIMSVVALRLLDLRERVRLHPDAPAQQAGLSHLELEVLRLRTRKPINTVREVALALGRMGGHMNRKGDGMPGWLTLWRGLAELLTLVEGVLLGRKLKRPG